MRGYRLCVLRAAAGPASLLGVSLPWVMGELCTKNFRHSAFILMRLSGGKSSVRALLLSLHPFCLRVPAGFSSHPNEREPWERMTHVIMYVWVNSASLVLVFYTYAALSNSQGDFILNGDFVVSMFKREIKVGNAVIEYSGSDNTIERINSTDRIEQEITLQVKYMLCVWKSPASITGLKNVGSKVCWFTLLHLFFPSGFISG